MNILFISDNFPPERNAAASRVYERACYWVKWGHEVTVITCAPNFPEGKLFSGYKNKFYQVEYLHGIRVVRVKTFIAENKGFFLRILDAISFTIPAVIATLFQRRPDVIVATSPSFFAAVSAFIAAKLRKRPFIFEVSDLWPASIIGVGAMRESFIIRFFEKLELFLYQHANEIIVLSPAFKTNLVLRHVIEDKIHVEMNGVDITKYSPRPRDNELAMRYQIAPEDFVIGYLGTHGMAHALENVLYAAELLKEKSNIRFMFVGAGATRESLVQIAKEKSLMNVTFVVAQAKEHMANFWSLCNFALVHLKNSPVFGEVIPSKIFEAMGMGLPILIAAPAGVAVSLVESEKVGVSVPAEDPHSLATTIRYYCDNQDLLKPLAEKSYQRAPYHSREQQARSFLKILEKYVKY